MESMIIMMKSKKEDQDPGVMEDGDFKIEKNGYIEISQQTEL